MPYLSYTASVFVCFQSCLAVDITLPGCYVFTAALESVGTQKRKAVSPPSAETRRNLFISEPLSFVCPLQEIDVQLSHNFEETLSITIKNGKPKISRLALEMKLYYSRARDVPLEEMKEIQTARYLFTNPQNLESFHSQCFFDGYHFLIINLTIFQCPISYQTLGQSEIESSSGSRTPKCKRRAQTKQRYDDRKLLINACSESIAAANLKLTSLVEEFKLLIPEIAQSLQSIFSDQTTQISTKVKNMLLSSDNPVTAKGLIFKTLMVKCDEDLEIDIFALQRESERLHLVWNAFLKSISQGSYLQIIGEHLKTNCKKNSLKIYLNHLHRETTHYLSSFDDIYSLNSSRESISRETQISGFSPEMSSEFPPLAAPCCLTNSPCSVGENVSRAEEIRNSSKIANMLHQLHLLPLGENMKLAFCCPVVFEQRICWLDSKVAHSCHRLAVNVDKAEVFTVPSLQRVVSMGAQGAWNTFRVLSPNSSPTTPGNSSSRKQIMMGINRAITPDQEITTKGFLDVHLIVLVHGLEGSPFDLRTLRNYMVSHGVEASWFFAESLEKRTHMCIQEQGRMLALELVSYIATAKIVPNRLSFIGFSLGGLVIRSALSEECFRPFLSKLHSFMSFSTPHLGVRLSDGVVRHAIRVLNKLDNSRCLQQLLLEDQDPEDPNSENYLVKLSKSSGLEHFANIIFAGSDRDKIVNAHSALIDICKSCCETVAKASLYQTMIKNLLEPISKNPNVNLIRLNVLFGDPESGWERFIGLAAHSFMACDTTFFNLLLTLYKLYFL